MTAVLVIIVISIIQFGLGVLPKREHPVASFNPARSGAQGHPVAQ